MPESDTVNKSPVESSTLTAHDTPHNQKEKLGVGGVVRRPSRIPCRTGKSTRCESLGSHIPQMKTRKGKHVVGWRGVGEGRDCSAFAVMQVLWDHDRHGHAESDYIRL